MSQALRELFSAEEPLDSILESDDEEDEDDEVSQWFFPSPQGWRSCLLLGRVTQSVGGDEH